MPLYRALVELRRVHRDADWVVAGVLLDDTFFPSRLDIEHASTRLIESGLVARLPLLPILAPDLRRALSVARSLTRDVAVDAASAADRDVLRGGATTTIAMGPDW